MNSALRSRIRYGENGVRYQVLEFKQAFPISNVKNPRVRNLIETVQRDFNNIISALGWEITFLELDEQHSYIVFAISRDTVIHKVGYLYSQSTDKAIYRILML